ncbi:MAG: FAD-linked oxidase C-terminal domain-containing protein [Nocardioidaceae bacterium]
MSHSSLVRELRERLSDEVLLITDPDVMAAYTRDRAPWVPSGIPAVIASPSHVDDVRRVLEIAAGHMVPVVPRGAGSGLSGAANAVDGCIVLSTHRLRAEPVVRPGDQLAHVAAGMMNAEVKQLAAGHGLFYPPDPASSAFCTIGGNVATNAGGLCCVRYGVTRDWVKKIEVVLPGGELVEFGSTTPKSVVGYDLAGLVVGSEGTLGVVTAATLGLSQEKPGHATMVAYFDRLSDVGSAVIGCLQRPSRPALLEVLDQTTLRAVESLRPMGLVTSAAALLIIQVVDDELSRSELAALASVCVDAGASETFSSADPAEADMLIEARRLAFEALERQGIPLLEDVCVDVTRLPELLDRIQQIAAQHGVTVGTFGHAGDGNLHPIVVVENASEEANLRGLAAFEAIMDVTLELGGTLSGEHGVGLLKQPFIERELGPRTLELMAGVKQVFDPLSIMNPGKSIGSVSRQPVA